MFKTVLLSLLPLYLFANSTHWQGDYDRALEDANENNRTLLVLVVKKDTPLCNEVIKNSFMNQPYITKINEVFLSVMVTYEGRGSYPIELYYTTVFPTLFFVNPKRETFLREPLYGDEINAHSLKKYFNLK